MSGSQSAGTLDSGGCDRSNSYSGWWHTPHRCRHGHQALRYDTAQSHAWPLLAQRTAGLQTAPDTAARSDEMSRRASSWHASGQLLQGNGCLLFDLLGEMGID